MHEHLAIRNPGLALGAEGGGDGLVVSSGPAGVSDKALSLVRATAMRAILAAETAAGFALEVD